MRTPIRVYVYVARPLIIAIVILLGVTAFARQQSTDHFPPIPPGFQQGRDSAMCIDILAERINELGQACIAAQFTAAGGRTIDTVDALSLPACRRYIEVRGWLTGTAPR